MLERVPFTPEAGIRSRDCCHAKWRLETIPPVVNLCCNHSDQVRRILLIPGLQPRGAMIRLSATIRQRKLLQALIQMDPQ